MALEVHSSAYRFYVADSFDELPPPGPLVGSMALIRGDGLYVGASETEWVEVTKKSDFADLKGRVDKLEKKVPV